MFDGETMNISAEVILGFVTALGAILTGAVTKMWLAFTGELKDCKEDRNALHVKVDSLHERFAEVSTIVGRLEGESNHRKQT